MASPELGSSPTLVAVANLLSSPLQPPPGKPSPILLPQPLATSRGFQSLTLPRKAQTEKIGFLHLPDYIRNRIYELAIYDHDRGAVFLPRALPRKVVPDIDDVEIACTEDQGHSDFTFVRNAPTERPLRVEATGEEDSAAAGYWAEEEDAQEAAVFSLGVPSGTIMSLTDRELLSILDDEDLSEPEVDSDDDEDTNSLVGIDTDRVAETILDEADATDFVIPEFEWVECNCDCHGSSSDHSDIDEMEEEIKQHIGEDREPSESPSSCDCGDAECFICCDLPAHFEVNEDPEENVFGRGDHGNMDDLEHFDTEEVMGMLYEPQEPAILMACKEIRKQCLLRYYAKNAFSWRFLWTDYRRSCQRFKSWANSVSAEAKLITKITFQGRHMIEEGIDFSIDIDLLERNLFFETSVYAGAMNDSVLCDIAETINRETASYLHLLTRVTGSRPSLTPGHLCELANIFVQGMHRDAGGCVNEEASSCRLTLSPLL